MVRLPCSLCRGPDGFNSVPGWGTKIPQAVQSGQEKKKKENNNNNKNPIQNGSTLGSVLTKAVHVVINTPNFFLSFDGKQKIEFIRISTGHKYVNSKTNQEAECVWILGFYAWDHILEYLTHLVLTKSGGSRRNSVLNYHQCSEIAWRKHTHTTTEQKIQNKGSTQERKA